MHIFSSVLFTIHMTCEQSTSTQIAKIKATCVIQGA